MTFCIALWSSPLPDKILREKPAATPNFFLGFRKVEFYIQAEA